MKYVHDISICGGLLQNLETKWLTFRHSLTHSSMMLSISIELNWAIFSTLPVQLNIPDHGWNKDYMVVFMAGSIAEYIPYHKGWHSAWGRGVAHALPMGLAKFPATFIFEICTKFQNRSSPISMVIWFLGHHSIWGTATNRNRFSKTVKKSMTCFLK